MNGKALRWTLLGIALLVLGLIQFIPADPVVIPAQLDEQQRSDHRVLNFQGINNFRDLGGYPAADGRQVRWGVLYRSGMLAKASHSDLRALKQLRQNRLIDFRSSAEKAEEPDRLPQPLEFDVVEIPTLDGGDNSVAEEIMARIETGDFEGFEPHSFMLEANRHFASRFTPQFRQFLQEVLAAGGEPVLWHCSAGKDRAGYASAILLRLLGVPEEVILEDYALSKQYSIDSRRNELRMLRLFKGEEAADKLAVIMGVEKPWLEAGLSEIDRQWGSWDNYVRDGLGLTEADIVQLRDTLLE